MAMDTIKIDNKQVKMVAHRGLSGLEKENTCSAFVAACNRATYFGVETDVHRTADGQYIIFHDDNTARVGIDPMVIEETTFDTLRKLQLTDIDGKRGRIDLTMPTLMEYIEICKKYGKHCVLELKNQFKAADVYKIVGMIEKAGYLDHVIFISFALKNLIYLRRRYPQQPAQFLIKEWDDKVLKALETYNLGIDIYYKSATPENVQKVHALGQEYNVWTVNEAVDGEALVEMKNRFFVGDELETVTPKGSEKLVIEDIVIERTGEHVGVVNVPMERVRIPCGGKLQAGDMLRGPVRNRA